MIALLPEVKKFLKSAPVKMLIGGKWTGAVSGKTFPVHDPGEGAIIAYAPEGCAPDIDLAVQAARQAFQHSGWASLPANDRAVLPQIELRDKVAGRVSYLAGTRFAVYWVA